MPPHRPVIDCPMCPTDPAPPSFRVHPALGLALVVKISPDYDHVETGVWCDDCALPSIVRIPLVERCHHGWPSRPIAWATICDECGASE